jgi:hypothetical protein
MAALPPVRGRWTTEVDENDDRRNALCHYIATLCEAGEHDPHTLQRANLRELDQERMKSR